MGNTLTFVFFVAVLMLLFVATALRTHYRREYRTRVKDARSLMSAQFEVILYPAKSPEFYVYGEKLPAREINFVRKDMDVLFRQGIKLQGEYVDARGRIIPDTEDFQKKLKEYHDLLTAKARNLGHEKIAQALTTAPYAYRREYYIPAKQPPLRREEPTFI